MVQPLRESRDRYEELKQIDDAMNEVGLVFCRQKKKSFILFKNPYTDRICNTLCSLGLKLQFLPQVQKKKSENLTIGGKKK